jgi:hypothetical protein
MKRWQVQIEGEGFVRSKLKMCFDIAGHVFAESPNHAFAKAIELAKIENPELSQADQVHQLGVACAVINAGEIIELKSSPYTESEEIEICWESEQGT